MIYIVDERSAIMMASNASDGQITGDTSMTESPRGAESQVRDYLQWLDDPSQLVDHAKVEQLEMKLANTKDPIKRLIVMKQLLQARTPQPDDLRNGFISSVKDYAAEQDIPPEAFRALGVPSSDLRQAGFAPLSPGGEGQVRARQSRVTTQQVQTQIPERPVTLRDVVEMTGAAPMTVRKAVHRMIESGELSWIGPDPDFAGRGKPPRRFLWTSLIHGR